MRAALRNAALRNAALRNAVERWPLTDLGRGGRPLRIGYGRIFHEACAWSPVPTVREDFTRLHHLEGPSLAAAVGRRGREIDGYLAHAELTGFAAAARLAGGVEGVPLRSSLAVPGGPLTTECFSWLLDGMEQAIREAGPLDGLYLALHGSMAVEGTSTDGLREAPEAIILRRARAAAGPGVRVAVSYDLHAHLTSGLVEPADILVGYRSNPHWDLFPTGFRAANRLIRTLRGQITPVHAWRKLPLVLGGGTTITFLSPMRQVFAAMKRMEHDPRVVTASLFMVHPFTDSDELGWAVHVTTDGDRALAESLADRLADLAWDQRDAKLPPTPGVEEALDQIAARRWRAPGPVSLIDIDDIVGAGAPGGSTRVIQAVAARDRGLSVYVPIHDPELVTELWETPVGARRDVVIRGTPGYHQPVVGLSATFAGRAEADFGRAVRLDAGGLHIVATERPPLPVHPSFWRALELAPRRADVLVQKNFFHYRMFYATTSLSHVAAVSEGATSFDRVRERHYRWPTHPQTHLEDWRPGLEERQRTERAAA